MELNNKQRIRLTDNVNGDRALEAHAGPGKAR